MRRVGNDYLLTKRSVLALAGSWLALAGVILWVGYQQIAINEERATRVRDVNAALVDACHRERANRIALRQLLFFFEGATLKNPSLTKKEKAQVLKFYNDALTVVPPVNCP